MTQKLGLYWFTNDLRLHDQAALTQAADSVDRLICFSHIAKSWSQSEQKMCDDLGINRRRFLYQSLKNLDSQLHQLNQRLWVTEDDLFSSMFDIIDSQNITDVYRSEHIGWFEKKVWENLTLKFPSINFHVISTHTLFDQNNLPFELSNMPAGFNGVRKKLEKSVEHHPIETLMQLPPLPETINAMSDRIAFLSLTQFECEPSKSIVETSFQGGEQVGLEHLASYLSSGSASTYKETRNALEGWQTSSKFSPWLALGCVSVRTIIAELKSYEAEYGANDSTYWIYVELLWREYFQWYAHRHGVKIFRHGGQVDKLLDYHHSESKIQDWILGETAYPLVNACMTELRLTGFLSNRGRQIVASCFVNELEQDWRFGAAYFEQVLIDFDIATNWGNWQYISGAGPASVDKKHFNLEKQASQFDPDQRYTKFWLSRR